MKCDYCYGNLRSGNPLYQAEGKLFCKDCLYQAKLDLSDVQAVHHYQVVSQEVAESMGYKPLS